jgi:hypothetical protein
MLERGETKRRFPANAIGHIWSLCYFSYIILWYHHMLVLTIILFRYFTDSEENKENLEQRTPN